ncbi:MAG: 16S rRNA (guanine(966)-N(2))-methyltransferase RsmD [Gammaproteobacteria bacterium]|nr:16S rRNA (guanine(966)-N(2))-methyltransferase RsmD [Gammaproteobacteria bacterium]
MRIIAGRWRGHRLKPLRGKGVRPTSDRVREAWMAALGADLEGAVVVDLFAGSGALGLEALSRGASHVTFVDLSWGALRVLRANVGLLGAGTLTRVVRADALGYTKRMQREEVDLALADPPYGRGLAGRLLDLYGERPFAGALWVEHRSREELPGCSGLRLRQRVYGDTTLTIAEADA